MSIQFNAGGKGLIALGIGAGDVASIVGMGRRIGNWYNATSGDDEFLDLLGEDTLSLLRRKGLIEPKAFNKRWGKELALLANGKPMVFKNEEAEKVTEQTPIGRFTAVMMCVVTALDTFTTSKTARNILRNVLKELFRTTDQGEDVLATQYPQRLSSWRSMACLRGLTTKASALRQHFLEEAIVMDGFMPEGESKPMEDFLVWLLSDVTDTFTTASSDIAAAGSCLVSLGIDVLTVHGLEAGSPDAACRLIYDPKSIVSSNYEQKIQSRAITMMGRWLTATVSLVHPEECVTHFPTPFEVHNRCRQAWQGGEKAAEFVALGVVPPKEISQNVVHDLQVPPDVRYAVIDRGSAPQRVSGKLQSLAQPYGLVINDEFLQQLKGCVGRLSDATLDWLDATNLDNAKVTREMEVDYAEFRDEEKIHNYCVLQSFCMGYYYSVFGRLVDTSSLRIPVVEGHWGFRSLEFLEFMRFSFWKEVDLGPQRFHKTISRQTMIEVLGRLFLNKDINLSTSDGTEALDRTGDWCLGAVAKRTLVANSLINPCYHPGDIGRFVLLDVDVGNVPRDPNGLIRPGLQEDLLSLEEIKLNGKEPVVPRQYQKNISGDVSMHIEADWNADPDKLLLCVRYRGRRITTISPTIADYAFCEGFVGPVATPVPAALPNSFPCYSSDLLNSDQERRLPFSKNEQVPIIVRVIGTPLLRYTAIALYAQTGCSPAVSTNCIHAAPQRNSSQEKPGGHGFVVIVGQEGGPVVTSSEKSTDESVAYAVEKIELRPGVKLGTNQAKTCRADKKARKPSK
ncbi:MAG: hypothetical protein M1821_008341 [Bathelium mastoideum]|nr:MAG: hypothetical protein M1821_008341 [Bathelium mastoideum]